MLTGSNWLTFRLKEDTDKNSKFIKFVTLNEKKNFIIYAEKQSHYLE